jgi:hypothetical protein
MQKGHLKKSLIFAARHGPDEPDCIFTIYDHCLIKKSIKAFSDIVIRQHGEHI